MRKKLYKIISGGRMRTLFILLSLLHIPFIVPYIDYYERFLGELPLVTYGIHFLFAYLVFAVITGGISSRVPLRWFFIVNGCILVSHGFLAQWLIAEEHAYWFKPFTPVMLVVGSASVYILIQGITRWAFLAVKNK